MSLQGIDPSMFDYNRAASPSMPKGQPYPDDRWSDSQSHLVSQEKALHIQHETLSSKTIP